MSLHILLILMAGILFIAIFIIPNVLKDRLLTMPMVFVGLGIIAFSLPLDLPLIDPESSSFDRKILEYLTEFIVIISLSAIGIKIDRKPSFKNWQIGFYLLGIAMPITIILLALAGYHFMGFSVGAALLLGSALAPTDPVLAGNVQVKPPNSGDGHKVRFGLTLEAGLNDGLAFPFIYLALIAEEKGLTCDSVLGWLGFEFAYKIIAAIIIGLIVGKVMTLAFFYLLKKLEDGAHSMIGEGVFVIGATLFTYGITEVAYGYGFLAVFIAAVTARQNQRDHPIHERTYESIDKVEQTALYVFLFVFGGLLATSGFEGLTWSHMAIAFLLLFVIRPIAGYMAFALCKMEKRERFSLSFFGIRGIGTIYYLAFANNTNSNFSQIDEVWHIANCCIVLSIIVHGIGAKLLMPKLEDDQH